MKRRIVEWFWLIVLSALGCGGTEDPGTGTDTLKVVATVEAEEQVPNATDPNDFDVDVSVWVTRDGLPVTDAVVRVTPGNGDVLLLERGDFLLGHYTLSRVGYHGSYQLDVEAGDDNVRDVWLEGPDIHTFVVPAPGQVVPAGENLRIEWDRGIEADQARIETKKSKDLTTSDSGSYLLPGSLLEGKPDKQEEDRITLWRSRRVGLDGGVGGSELVVKVRNRVEFLIGIAP